MEETTKKRRNPLLRLLFGLLILLLVPVVLLVVMAGLSLIGRINSSAVIPATYVAYVQIPAPVDTVQKLVEEESFAVLLTEPALSGLAPLASEMRESGILKNPLVRFAGNRNVDAAVLPDGSYLGCVDLGIFSPLAGLLPFITSRMSLKELTFQPNGQLSRFEYRSPPPKGSTVSGTVLYLAVYRNLVLISGSATLLDNVRGGQTMAGTAFLGSRPEFRQDNHDVGILLSSGDMVAPFLASEGLLGTMLSSLDFSGKSEIALTVEENKLRVTMMLPVSSAGSALAPVLSRQSAVPGLYSLLPADTQFSTVLSTGTLQELLTPIQTFAGAEFGRAWRQADSASKMVLGIDIAELLFSWTGTEFAVFGLAGRPQPVFAVQVADERKRQEIFSKLVKSFALSEDDSVVLDGIRVPQIRLPDFLAGLVRLWNVTLPSPYYIEQDGFLFISESPENLVSAVNAIRRNRVLVKTGPWKSLSGGVSSRSAVSLFYSLDRAVPFFLKGNGTAEKLLKLYRQGLASVSIEDEQLRLSLTVISGTAEAVRLLGGFPITMQGRLDNRLDMALFSRKGESRILAVEDSRRAVSINPVTGQRFEYASSDPLWVLAGAGLEPDSAADNALWILSERGTVALASGDLEIHAPFPIATGSRVTAAPRAVGGKLYFPDSEGLLNVVDRTGEITRLTLPFTEVMRSSPDVLITEKTGYLALYPKSFFAGLYLTDLTGNLMSGWPVSVSGIAFGSPVLLTVRDKVLVAFLTQAGELSLYNTDGSPAPGFPLQLPGVFYAQPVFDGAVLWALSEDGTLFQVSPDALVLSQSVRSLTVSSGYLVAADIDNDRSSEVILSGDANALYAFSKNFTLQDGFPVPAWGRPYLGDFNGDGKIECVAAGLDNKIYAWQIK